MQDFIVFCWKYSSLEYNTHDYAWEWEGKEIFITSLDYVCHIKWKLGSDKLYLGKVHGLISRHPMPIIAALGSQLAEIGIRTTFVVMTSVAALLFEELDGRLEALAEKSNADVVDNVQQISQNLAKWKSQYDLVIRFIEKINRTFGLVLLLTCAIDFAVPIVEFNSVLSELTYNNGRDVKYNFQFAHLILRFLVILIASHRVESKVGYIFF